MSIFNSILFKSILKKTFNLTAKLINILALLVMAFVKTGLKSSKLTCFYGYNFIKKIMGKIFRAFRIMNLILEDQKKEEQKKEEQKKEQVLIKKKKSKLIFWYLLCY